MIKTPETVVAIISAIVISIYSYAADIIVVKFAKVCVQSWWHIVCPTMREAGYPAV
jgi:hypothetical protein